MDPMQLLNDDISEASAVFHDLIRGNTERVDEFLIRESELLSLKYGGREIIVRDETPAEAPNEIVIADLHGDIESLFIILRASNFYSDTNQRLIFLGDIKHRGEHCLFTDIFCRLLFIKYPNVDIILGNHEDLSCNEAFKASYMSKHIGIEETSTVPNVLAIARRDHLVELSKIAKNRPLQIIYRDRGILFCHAGPGIPYKKDSETRQYYVEGDDFSVIGSSRDMALWSDFDLDKEGKKSARGFDGSVYYGAKSFQALKQNRINLMFAGHKHNKVIYEAEDFKLIILNSGTVSNRDSGTIYFCRGEEVISIEKTQRQHYLQEVNPPPNILCALGGSREHLNVHTNMLHRSNPLYICISNPWLISCPVDRRKSFLEQTRRSHQLPSFSGEQQAQNLDCLGLTPFQRAVIEEEKDFFWKYLKNQENRRELLATYFQFEWKEEHYSAFKFCFSANGNNKKDFRLVNLLIEDLNLVVDRERKLLLTSRHKDINAKEFSLFYWLLKNGIFGYLSILNKKRRDLYITLWGSIVEATFDLLQYAQRQQSFLSTEEINTILLDIENWGQNQESNDWGHTEDEIKIIGRLKEGLEALLPSVGAIADADLQEEPEADAGDGLQQTTTEPMPKWESDLDEYSSMLKKRQSEIAGFWARHFSKRGRSKREKLAAVGLMRKDTCLDNSCEALRNGRLRRIYFKYLCAKISTSEFSIATCSPYNALYNMLINYRKGIMAREEHQEYGRGFGGFFAQCCRGRSRTEKLVAVTKLINAIQSDDIANAVAELDDDPALHNGGLGRLYQQALRIIARSTTKYT